MHKKLQVLVPSPEYNHSITSHVKGINQQAPEIHNDNASGSSSIQNRACNKPQPMIYITMFAGSCSPHHLNPHHTPASWSSTWTSGSYADHHPLDSLQEMHASSSYYDAPHGGHGNQSCPVSPNPTWFCSWTLLCKLRWRNDNALIDEIADQRLWGFQLALHVQKLGELWLGIPH